VAGKLYIFIVYHKKGTKAVIVAVSF